MKKDGGNEMRNGELIKRHSEERDGEAQVNQLLCGKNFNIREYVNVD